MEVNNPLYKNQGIHLISTIFTVEDGITKVLLIKRKNNPYKDYWTLVGGALYNNEDLIDGLKRELKEKTGIENIKLDMFNVYGKLNRSPVFRMVAVGYIGVIDREKLSLIKETLKTSNADWFNIECIPTLAYDHNEILNDAVNKLKEKIYEKDFLKDLFPSEFTLPELQKVYETILGEKLDRRNFRKKLLNLDLIEDTLKEKKFDGNKPAKLYKFK